MRRVLAIGMLTLACSCSSSRTFHIERRVTKSDSSFEGVAHRRELWLASQNLGPVGQWSISPSGRFAAFETSGSLKLCDGTTGRSSDITTPPFALPTRFDWRESARELTIAFEPLANRPSETIKLPK
jgi:hypothetical protein